ncbi:MAG: hypothetical protein H8Z69_01735 [Nanohaloarchaea archaeon]|nr:hypothetical protein [Candidatus Nanohaloarchaea archaeon]
MDVDQVDEDAVTAGLLWLNQKSEDFDEAVIAVPVKSNLEGTIENVLGKNPVKGLKKGEGVELSRSGAQLKLFTERNNFRYTSGPVLTLYAGRDLLEKVDEDLDTASAVCVVSDRMDEIRPWIKANEAETAGPGKDISNETSLNSVVENALESFDLTCNSSMLHSMDIDRLKDGFHRLDENGYDWTPDEIWSWLKKEGWSESSAQKAREIAREVRKGKSHRYSEKLADNIVKKWEEE